jgi:hypothetical protein
VSHRRLRRDATLPRAVGRWALDSGGFSERAMYGGWVPTADEYIAAVQPAKVHAGRQKRGAGVGTVIAAVQRKRRR